MDLFTAPLAIAFDLAVAAGALSFAWGLRPARGRPSGDSASIADSGAEFAAPGACIALAAFYLGDLALTASGGGFQNWPWLLAPLAAALLAGTLMAERRRAAAAEQRARANAENAASVRRRMENFLAASSDWYWETDVDERFTWFSENVLTERHGGRRRSYGKTREEIAHTHVNPEGWAAYRAALDARQPFRDFEYCRNVNDGERWVRVSGVPAFDADGAFIGYRGVGADITAEVQADAAANRNLQLLSAAIEQLQEGFSLWDADDRLVLCNRKFREINAFYGGAFKPGEHFEDFVRAGIDNAQLAEAVGREAEWFEARMAHHRNPSEQGMLIERSDGLHALVTEQKLQDGYTVTIALDISDWRKAEQAVAESESLLGAIIDNLPIGLVIKDLSLKVERMNQTFCDWYGVDRNDLENLSTDRPGFTSDEEKQALLEDERQVLQTGESTTSIIDRRFADGSIHAMQVSKFPVLGRDGRVMKVGSVSVDLTRLITVQTALRESEARFRDYAEIASDWQWETDAEHRFNSFSEQPIRDLGYEPKSYLGKTRWELANANIESDAFWIEFCRKLEAHEEFRDVEYWFTEPTGERRCMRISGRPTFDKNGAFTGYRGVASDVTAQRIAEQRLRDHEALLSAVLDNSPSLVTIRDRDGRLVMANRAFNDIMSQQGVAALGAPIGAVVPQSNASQLERQHNRVVETGEALVEEVELQLPDGPVTELILRFPIPGPDGRVALVGMISTDISDRKSMEVDLQAAKNRAEEASRAKSAFLARMSHELRTPLNAVIGFGQLLRSETRGPLGHPEYNDYAADIVESGEYLLALVNDILDMSQIEAGEFKPQYVPCRVADIAKGAINLVRHAAKGPMAQLAYEADPDLPNAWADQRALRQVLVNLLSNAAKFTPADGKITVEARRLDDSRLWVSVVDTGEGILPEEMERILEPFSTRRRGQDPYEPNRGIGLGLSIVKGIVEAHGGALEIESAPGKGARFSFALAAQPEPVTARRAAG